MWRFLRFWNKGFFYLRFLFRNRFLIFIHQLKPLLFSQLLKKFLITPQLNLFLLWQCQSQLFRRTIIPWIIAWKIPTLFWLQFFKMKRIMLLKKVNFFLEANFMIGTILANFFHTSLRLHPFYRQLIWLSNLYTLEAFRVILHLFFWIRDIFSNFFQLIIAVIFTHKIHSFLGRTGT